MNETSKAVRRRYVEEKTGGLSWSKIFRGVGLDLGCGPDKLPFDKCQGFDQEQGDAAQLSSYFPLASQDYIHASQLLEHLPDPAAAVSDWLRVVKPRGHIVITVPDFTRYEHLQWPSIFNPEHLATFSFDLPASPAPTHCKLPEWLDQFKDRAEILLCSIVDTGYNYALLNQLVDQTLEEAAGVECWCEFVLQRKSVK